MRLAFAPYMLHFRQPAGTSRGVLTEKPTVFLKVWDEQQPDGPFGLGEAALFPGLSPEDRPEYPLKLMELLANVAIGKPTDLSEFPSIRFGFEQALLDFASGGRRIYFPGEFTRGESEITINGLIWMGSQQEMLARVEEKLEQGFHCLKLKIGARQVPWSQEVEILESIRRRFSAEELTVRVDANGGFTMDNALPRLARLASLDIHSIEQPIPAGNPELMAFLCQTSPVPIALDEELIGIHREEEKRQLLELVKPAYIILKPTLCGGIEGSGEWISIAESLGIGWWITSALESNVGLNALAQWTATLGNPLPQGLGTGALFTNNLPSPLELQDEHLRFNPKAMPPAEAFRQLDWRY